MLRVMAVDAGDEFGYLSFKLVEIHFGFDNVIDADVFRHERLHSSPITVFAGATIRSAQELSKGNAYNSRLDHVVRSRSDGRADRARKLRGIMSAHERREHCGAQFGECGGVDSERSVDLQINCGFGVSAALGKQISLILQFAVHVRSTGDVS